MVIFSRKNLLRLGLPVLTVVMVGSIILQPIQQRAAALSGGNFNPGHIIDDTVFTDANAMSEQAIQNFLDAKVGSCDNSGSQSAAPYNSGTKRTLYDASIGKNTTFTCINQYYENISTHANNLDSNPIPSGAISAAQIIYNEAQQYQINPQVLIATLQKEQGLVTDTWPWDSEYTEAMGYACPDTAPCASQYYGFYNQVSNAAWQFRQYLTNPNNYNYVVGSDHVLWSPASGCGGANVTIQNEATAALYDYTPYQPNAAALANVSNSSSGGSGDSCSSYGNRNFWWYFNTWFGSSLAPAFAWQAGPVVIEDQGQNAVIPTDNMHSGERLYVQVSAENIGTTTWTNSGSNPMRLGTVYPYNTYTPYCDTSWTVLCDRSSTLLESSVAPGQTGHFDFYMAVPNSKGAYRYYFEPVSEYQSWMSNDAGFNIYVNNTGFYQWQWLYFDAYTDSSKTTPVDMNNVTKGQQIYIVLHAKNTSATVWSNSGSNPTRLGTTNPYDQNSPLCTTGWVSCNRPATLDQSTLAPGQEGTFSFYIKAPSSLGVYRQYVQPVLEYQGWTAPSTQNIYMNVTQ
jgi:hypothetical protein